MGINNSAQGVENRENISRHDIAHTRVRTIAKTDTVRPNLFGRTNKIRDHEREVDSK
jgi:hypothetical protein